MLKPTLAALLVATSTISGPTIPVTSPVPRVNALYSHRALYRARLILQLRLLEARGEGLTRLRKLLEERLKFDGQSTGLDYSHICD